MAADIIPTDEPDETSLLVTVVDENRGMTKTYHVSGEYPPSVVAEHALATHDTKRKRPKATHVTVENMAGVVLVDAQRA